MNMLPVEREAIMPRVDGMRRNIQKLEELAKLPFKEFSEGDAFDLAQHHLRLALEGIFHISSHILSRLPGARANEYKEVARKMGEQGIVPKAFCAKALVPMAGMRNILVHHYADIDAKRLHNIIKKHTKDIDTFLNAIKKFMKHPEKFGISLR
ncbi:MAG: DUF86 domain-containing protein [Deltaproteobacteria bacterium]|nr:DUF86 domain-containing protein [Deltaproteobacteria bacterium]